MRVIVRTCAGREDYLKYVLSILPHAEVCFDDVGGASANYIKSLEMAGDSAVLNIEDDILFCDDFIAKAARVIQPRQNAVIQFFTMRKACKEIGSRWEAGSGFMSCLCNYYPPKVSKGLLAFATKWQGCKSNGKHIDLNSSCQPLDVCVAKYLQATKQRYWIECPHLVNHRVGRSAIDPKRGSTNRVSTNFIQGT